jgi:hypothetical protein
MLRIRDLGITAVPERGARMQGGLLAQCPQHSGQCEPCTPQTGPCEPPCTGTGPCEPPCTGTGPCAPPCTGTGNCPPCSDVTGNPGRKKAQAFTHEAVSQLQHQMQQRIANLAI